MPNCDGIDPDHCRDVEIKNCHITCGDDAIVIKTTRQPIDYGPCENIRVSDCILETQDAGLKIGTETTRDIRNLTFQRCKIITSSRGIGIQLRDEGNISNITFKDITFTSRYYSAPWWGRGEAISLTAIPRAARPPTASARADGASPTQPAAQTTDTASALGTLSNIHFQNITGTSENSLRIDGTAQSPIQNISLDNLHLTLRRWTDQQKYPNSLRQPPVLPNPTSNPTTPPPSSSETPTKSHSPTPPSPGQTPPRHLHPRPRSPKLTPTSPHPPQLHQPLCSPGS